jgi:hypothetical protein
LSLAFIWRLSSHHTCIALYSVFCSIEENGYPQR